MTQPGTVGQPLRVAIVGSGPAGFYVAEHLLNRDGLSVHVDMYERLCWPYGLVRFGVAPDHEKIKRVTRTFDNKAASKPGFRFYGNVEVGTDVTLDDLRAHYHQICFASGAQTDRRMGIPGEDLGRSRTATEFVAWYNGHPDYRDHHFDLSVERVAIVGVGNVAVDVARILCRTPDELSKTDIADYALDALRESKVREVHMLGRRGPMQAAFTNPEVRELGALQDADVAVVPSEVALDAASEAQLDGSDRATNKKLEILRDFAAREPSGKRRRLVLRFLVSPVEILDDGTGHVGGLKLVRNELYQTEDGTLRPRATDHFEELPADIVFRSVGYRGIPIAGLPFDDRRGMVPNVKGRVTDPGSHAPLPGIYVSGWIKRGPTGVIGTNKPDALETVHTMLGDLAAGNALEPAHPEVSAADHLARERQPNLISYEDFKRLDELETGRGTAQGRPRVKFTSTNEVLEALGRRA